MADEYFAVYTEDSVPAKANISLISDGTLSKILIDSDEIESLFQGSGFALDTVIR